MAMAARARFSKSDAIMSLIAIASVVIVFIIVALPRSHDYREVKRQAYAQEPYRYISGATEKCVKLWFSPPPDFPEEEIAAFCDALLLKIYDYIKGRNDLIPPSMEAAGEAEKFVNKTEEARDEMEEARIFQTLLVMTDWSSK